MDAGVELVAAPATLLLLLLLLLLGNWVICKKNLISGTASGQCYARALQKPSLKAGFLRVACQGKCPNGNPKPYYYFFLFMTACGICYVTCVWEWLSLNTRATMELQ